jgi:membrane protein DedA with SNARE-associated domain
MSIAALVARYGLLGVLLGSGVEGEAVVVTGGILAHRGFFPLWQAMIASAVGSCAVDQLWFFLGRYGRRFRWVQAAAKRPAFARALGYLERHPTAFIFGFRFVYGMRTISPIVIGTTSVPTARFVVLNAIAAAIWGPLFSWIGFEFGRAIDPLLHHLQEWALYAAAGVALVAVAIAFVIRRLHIARSGPDAPAPRNSSSGG